MSTALEEYLNAGLGTDAVITTASGQFTIKVRFFNKYKVAKLGGFDVEGSSPQIHCLTSSLPDIKHGNEIVIPKEGRFFIGEIQPQGNNKTIIDLSYD